MTCHVSVLGVAIQHDRVLVVWRLAINDLKTIPIFCAYWDQYLRCNYSCYSDIGKMVKSYLARSLVANFPSLGDKKDTPSGHVSAVLLYAE